MSRARTFSKYQIISFYFIDPREILSVRSVQYGVVGNPYETQEHKTTRRPSDSLKYERLKRFFSERRPPERFRARAGDVSYNNIISDTLSSLVHPFRYNEKLSYYAHNYRWGEKANFFFIYIRLMVSTVTYNVLVVVVIIIRIITVCRSRSKTEILPS